MTNKEKSELRKLAKTGMTLSEIKRYVTCSDQTIRNYIKIFATKGEKHASETSNEATRRMI